MSRSALLQGGLVDVQFCFLCCLGEIQWVLKAFERGLGGRVFAIGKQLQVFFYQKDAKWRVAM